MKRRNHGRPSHQHPSFSFLKKIYAAIGATPELRYSPSKGTYIRSAPYPAASKVKDTYAVKQRAQARRRHRAV